MPQISTPPQGWKVCTSDRMCSFWGVVIAMGVKCLLNLMDYCSLLTLLGCPNMIKSWPYNKFCALLSSLYFSDNSSAILKGQPGYDRLHKVRPFLEIVEERCKTLYKPDLEFAHDEAIVAMGFSSSLGRDKMA